MTTSDIRTPHERAAQSPSAQFPSAAKPLDEAYRRASLERLAAEHLDILVVGGGVVGAGAALDAASRGLRVGLVEARDFAAGTSSRSSKLIHGGLRYLEMLEFGLVAQALAERGLLLERIAPHLVRPVPFLYPLHHRGWERLYAGTGVALYDAMATVSRRRGGIPWHRHVTRRRIAAIAPGLDPGRLAGGLVYYDAQVDDARYTMTLARTAASLGAAVATGARVVSLTTEGRSVTGATVVDEADGTRFDIRASCVLNATGVWAAELESLGLTSPGLNIRASKGVHLVVPRDRFRSEVGVIMRTEKSVLFVIPWNQHWLIGTTDSDWDYDKSHPAASGPDIDYLLAHVNQALRVPLTRADVVGVYVGLRPLVEGGDSPASTAKVSREHAIVHDTAGLVSVAGGKYTTYRVMALDAVDAAVADLDRAPVPPSCTDRLPLVGADGYVALRNQIPQLAASYSLEPDTVDRLLGRYGALITEVLAATVTDPTLREPLAAAPGYLRAEAVYAASHEGARHLDDVLTRRTRISIEQPDRGLSAAAEVADLMGVVLGWTPQRRESELAAYRVRVDAELKSQLAISDDSANAARNPSWRRPARPPADAMS